MTTKKKLIISMTSMGLAVAAALGVTFGVLAAQNQAIRSQFSVTYSALHVNATIKASYKLKNDAEAARVSLTGANSETSISFVSTEDTTTKTLSAAEAAVITPNKNYAVYTFEFKNDATVGGKDLTIALTDSSAKTNTTSYYYAATSATEITSSNYYDVVTHTTVSSTPVVYLGSTSDNDAATLSTSVPATLTVAPQEYGYFYIVVELINDTIDGTYVSSTSDNSGVAWALASVEPTVNP